MTHRPNGPRRVRRALAAALALAALWASQACAGMEDCPAGLTPCGDALCSNLKSDRENCGACGKACGSGQSCQGGECVQSCPISGQTRCPNGCFDLRHDADSCGACGIKCPEGAVCASGRCDCGIEDLCGKSPNLVCCTYEEACVDGACVPK